MVLLTLSTVLPLIIVGLSVVVIYRQDLRASFIAVEGIVLMAGILFSFFSVRKLILPFQGPGNTVGYEGLVKDISDRERIEEDLIKSEERYRTVLENIQDGYFEIDLAGNYTFVNDAECINLGYTREELIGMNNRQYTDKENAKKMFQAFNRVYRTGEPVTDLDLEIIKKDGTKAFDELSVSLITDSEGRATGFRGISRDVTERKRAEEALRESEEKYRSILENIEDGYSEVDLAGNFTFVNDVVCRRLGFSREELIGMNNRQYADETTAKKTYQIYNRVYRTGEPVRSFEEEIIRKDGTRGIYELSVSLIRNSEGKPVGFRSIARDITERKQAEEALRESEARLQVQINRMPIGCIVWDREFRVLSWNPAAERIFGFTVEEALGRHPYNFIVPKAAQPPIDAIWRRLLNGDTTAHSLNENITKDGRIIICDWSNTPLKDGSGCVMGVLSMVQDITDRKRAEEALRQSEERYRTIIDNIQDGYLEVDLAGNFTFVNDAECKNLGYTREELTGMNNRRYMDEENAKKVFQAFNTVYRTGEPVKGLDLEVIKKDGTKAFDELSVSLIRDSEGRPIGFRGISRDVTERKRAEEALRLSEERYRNILKSIEEGYYEVDLTGNFTFVNDSMCQIFGYPREELMDMNDRQYTDQETTRKLFQAFNEVYRTGKPGRAFEYEITRKDGAKRHVETSISLRKDASGNAVGFRGIIRDVTERKRAEEALRQSEEKYRTILESIQEGYFEDDLSGNLTFFNDVLCRDLGYAREELTGMNYRRRVDEKDARKVGQAYRELYRTEEPIKALEAGFVRKDGTKLIAEFSASLIRNSEGRPIGFRSISRDITDKKRIEEQLFQAEKLRAVGEMASGVAHDFNNALAAILGNTQLLLYTVQDEELKETLKIIEKVAKDSSQTVRRLQEFTRKRIPQELFKIDVNAIVKDSIEITKPKWKDEAQSRGIHIEMVSNLEDIPLASGSTSELREVITNMIFNAIEAMHDGGKIQIRTFREGKDVVIQISDTGVGIAEETKERIFEPFFTTKPFTNTGLGLSMSYGIVKRFGGEIEVESKVGQGTAFTITLPIGQDEKEEAVDSQPIKKGRRARILVIDDDEFVRSVLSRTLAQADHQVTLAEDGRKGVQLFKEGEFDVVLTDLGMPGVSGWEVCRMIKEINPHTPVGMVTGWGDEKNRSKMEECGLDFFISKPFDFAQILNVVAETMESGKE